MKLLLINTTIGFGSTGRITESLAEIAFEADFKCIVGYGRGQTSISNIKALKIGNKFDFIWHGFSSFIFDNHGLSSTIATKKFIKEIEDFNPDIVHLHNIHGYFLNYKELFLLLKRMDKPVVWTFHDSWPFTGHCTYFDNIACEKWKTACFECPKTRYYPTSYFLDNSNENFKTKKELFTSIPRLNIVTPSYWLANLVSMSFFSDIPTHVIHNGIDINIFRIKHLSSEFLKTKGLDKKKIILGVASIWDKRKGLNDFIELSKFINSDYYIVLIGLDVKQLKKIPKNIIGISRTNNLEELVDWYNAATVFVNPTWQDNFPTTNIESLACGTPVITYNTGGSPEALNSTCGLVVEKGDIKALLNGIEGKFNQKSPEITDECRKHAVKRFYDKSQFKKYITLYNSFYQHT